MTPKLFSELGLSPEMLKAIDRLGFEQTAPIQAATIPVLMQGRDVVGQSQTGSGKTAAFAIPAIEKTDPQLRAVQVLILCPTRELAVQVSEEVHKLAFFKRGIHALPIYGGQSYERQYQGLRQGAQIIIGTPGRVMDHMNRGTMNLGQVKMLVLDEADVMLDMGFREDIEFILKALPPTRQTVFFSATMPRPIQDLIERFAREPEQVRIQQATMTVPTVEQVYYEVDRRFKVELLTRLIDIHDLKLGIIFCNTKRMVDELVDHLEAQGYSADRLHGDMTQMMRDRVMNRFRKSGLEFLVATDVAARGIDVNDVEVVFNYDLPYDVEDYVHRIGRTGRAGRSGMAVSFVAGREVFQIRNIERFTRTRIQRGRVPTEAQVEEARADAFLGKVRATLQSGDYPRQDRFVERLLEEGFSTTDIASALLHHLQGGEPAAVAKVSRPAEWASNPVAPAGPPTARPAPAAAPRPIPPKPAPSTIPKRPASAAAILIPTAPSSSSSSSSSVSPQSTTPITTHTGLAITAPESASAQPAIPQPATREPAKPSDLHRMQRPASSLKAPPTKPTPTSAPRPFIPKATPNYAPAPAASQSPAPPIPPRNRPGPPWVKPGAPTRSGPPIPAPKPPPRKPDPGHRTPEHQTRLFINIGSDMGIKPSDIVELVMGNTGLPAKVVGTVEIRDRHLFVDVDAEHANSIAAKLNRSYHQTRKLRVKVA